MSAEVRRVRGQAWVVDLACQIEEPWEADLVGALMRADLHNEDHHAQPAEDLSDLAGATA